MKIRTLRVELWLLRIVAHYETSSVTSWVEAVTNCRHYETSSVMSWVEAVTNCCPLWNFVRYELSWGCYELLPTMKLRPLRVELRLLRIVARYETSNVTSWVEAVTNCCPLWNFVRYELSWGCYKLSPSMKLRPLPVELRLLRIVAGYETSSVTVWVEAVKNCRPLWKFERYELSYGCYELLPTMKLRPLRVELRLLRIVATMKLRPSWVELRLLRIVAHYETSSVTSWVEAVTSCCPLWNFVRYELSWGCYELSPAMKLRTLRVELRLLRIVAHYETSSVTSWVEAVTNCRHYETSSVMSWVEAVTNCCPLWNFVRYELSWGCYELLPTMKLRPLRVELRLLRVVAHYETSSVTSWVEAVTNCRPLWNFVRMSWVEAVTNCWPLWNFVRYELSWGCYELSHAMKLHPLRVELRLLRIVDHYETSSVMSWVEAVMNCRMLWNFIR